MYRVHAEHEVVRMLDSRTQDEARCFKSFKFQRTVRLFEHRQLAPINYFGRRNLSSMHSNPSDCVIGRRLIAPLLALRQRNVQVVDRGWRGNFARGCAVAAKDHTRRTMRLKVLAAEVLSCRFDAFHLRRKRDP